MSTLKKWQIDDVEISYDSMVDSLYMRYQEGEFSHNVDLADWITADVNANDEILGIEFIGISQRIPLQSPLNKQEICKISLHLLPYLTQLQQTTR